MAFRCLVSGESWAEKGNRSSPSDRLMSREILRGGGGSGKERRRGRGEESLLYLISVFTTRVSTTSEALDMGCGMSGEQ